MGCKFKVRKALVEKVIFEQKLGGMSHVNIGGRALQVDETVRAKPLGWKWAFSIGRRAGRSLHLEKSVLRDDGRR